MAIVDQILALTKQLLPTGRAFRVPYNGYFEKLLNGLHASEARAYQDALSILDSALPDNDNFSTDDAAQWEKRLGLITNTAVDLADRKLAIKRKMAHPGLIPARQNYLYVQGQLQAAGFNVYVYENIFPGYFGNVTKTMDEWKVPSEFQYGQIRYGQQNYGPDYTQTLVANNIDEALDASFDVGATLRSTFFIGGSPEGTKADVPLIRKDEFRQLILKLKPTQMVAYLLIEYV
jgi:hypothetical protein